MPGWPGQQNGELQVAASHSAAGTRPWCAPSLAAIVCACVGSQVSRQNFDRAGASQAYGTSVAGSRGGAA